MQICGDITDEDIVKSNAELEEVLQLAAGRSIDETKKGVRAAIRETKRKRMRLGLALMNAEKAWLILILQPSMMPGLTSKWSQGKLKRCGRKS